MADYRQEVGFRAVCFLGFFLFVLGRERQEQYFGGQRPPAGRAQEQSGGDQIGGLLHGLVRVRRRVRHGEERVGEVPHEGNVGQISCRGGQAVRQSGRMSCRCSGHAGNQPGPTFFYYSTFF